MILTQSLSTCGQKAESICFYFTGKESKLNKISSMECDLLYCNVSNGKRLFHQWEAPLPPDETFHLRKPRSVSPPATGKGTQACSVSHGGTPETFIFRPFTARPRRAPRAFAAFRLATIYLPQFLLLKWVVVKYTRVPLPVAGGTPVQNVA